MRTVLRLWASAGSVLAVLGSVTTVQAAQTINTSSTTSCVAQGGVISGANLLTDFDNGTFGTESGAPDQSPTTDPYPATVVGGIFDHFYDFNHGDYGYISNPVTPRNPFQHPEITDPVYGAAGRFFASDPNADTPTMHFSVLGVVPNQNYELSFWAANSEPNGIPNIVNAVVNGVVSFSTGELQAFPAALEWRRYGVVFNAGSQTALQISMQSTETGPGGRDFYLDNVELRPCVVPGGSISGSVYIDANGDNALQSGTEPPIGLIEVTLWDTRGTSNTADDILVSTSESIGNGSYSFSNIVAGNDYEVRVKTDDPDLPSDSTPGTATALPITVTSGGNTSGHDFGFDAGAAVLSGDKTIEIFDPNAEGLYAIPSNDVIYTISISNVGTGRADLNSLFLVDSLPSEVTFYNADMDDAGPITNPVNFSQNSAALNWTYSRDVGFSSSAIKPTTFAQCNYTPTAGYDPAVRHVCFAPNGRMQFGNPDPSFSVSFRARIN